MIESGAHSTTFFKSIYNQICAWRGILKPHDATMAQQTFVTRYAQTTDAFRLDPGARPA